MPASWEIMAARRNRVLISTIYPADGKVSMDWASSTARLERPLGSATFFPSGLPYHAARNAAAKATLDSGFAFLFFLDSDLLPPPNVITQLLATGRDLVGALYFKRGAPYEPAAGMAVSTPEDAVNPVKVGPLPRFNYGDIIPVDFLPCGATLISRRVIEAMVETYRHPFAWGADPAFGPALGPDGLPMPAFSEDYLFSFRAKQLGFQPWLHSGLICNHEMTGWVGLRGLVTPER